MKIISFMLLILYIGGCSDDKGTAPPVSKPIDTPESGFSGGFINVKLKDSVSFEDFAGCVFKFDSSEIWNVTNLHYFSRIPKDSMQAIDSVLKSKSYIESYLLKTSYSDSDNVIQVSFSITVLKQEDFEDWVLSKERFQLSQLPYHSSAGILKVLNGKEQEWINYLSKTNYFVQVTPIGILGNAAM
jgi:hypothetical protein